MNAKALIATAVSILAISSATQAATFKIDIKPSEGIAQTDTIATPFTPHFGYAGGPVQSWGFGQNSAQYGGWLDFYHDGVSILNEAATPYGNLFYATTEQFYALSDSNQLSFLQKFPNNSGTKTYDLVGGGTLTLTEVPEPATWAMMLIGFGGLGAALRMNRRRTTAIAA
jgi:hypothetical protein